MDELLNPKQVAARLNRSHKYLTSKRVARWGLPVVKIDHHRLFKASDVEDLIARSVVVPSVPSAEEKGGDDAA